MLPLPRNAMLLPLREELLAELRDAARDLEEARRLMARTELRIATLYRVLTLNGAKSGHNGYAAERNGRPATVTEENL